jgi:Arc/MetJ-type ribon-helix-helix transcriptional regulator
MKSVAENGGMLSWDERNRPMLHQLPPDISERLQACVASGSYRSEEEVLREALDALEQREQDKLRRWHEGNKIATEQSRQGLSKPLDDEAVVARLRQRLAAEGITD